MNLVLELFPCHFNLICLHSFTPISSHLLSSSLWSLPAMLRLRNAELCFWSCSSSWFKSFTNWSAFSRSFCCRVISDWFSSKVIWSCKKNNKVIIFTTESISLNSDVNFNWFSIMLFNWNKIGTKYINLSMFSNCWHNLQMCGFHWQFNHKIAPKLDKGPSPLFEPILWLKHHWSPSGSSLFLLWNTIECPICFI